MKQKQLRDETRDVIFTSQLKISHKIKVESQYLQLYSQAFADIQTKCEQHVPDFSQKLIDYHEGKHNNFSLKIVDQINNFEIVVARVKIGCFTVPIKILNINANSPLLRENPQAEGVYGSLFMLTFLGQQIAVKSFKVDYSSHRINLGMISKVVQQYCILQICDAMKCGPHSPKSFGFDVIVFNNSIEFVMEKCQKRKYSKNQNDQMLECLGMLHRFKIIHMDITWNNIMFSPHHNKNVFIDFGFSTIIAEECGFKTYTSFKGTLDFVSKEMMALFSSRKAGDFIDLYFNDLSCLQKVKQEYSKQSKSGYQLKLNWLDQKSPLFEQEGKKSDDYADYFIVLLKFRYYFDYQRMFSPLRENNCLYLKNYGRDILNLFLELLPSTFYEETKSIKQLQQLPEYKQVLQKTGQKKYTIFPEDKQKTEKQLSLDHSFQQRFCDEAKLGDEKESVSIETIEPLLKNLKKILTFSSEDQIKCMELCFECIRFDKANFDIKHKKILALAFLKQMQLQIVSSTEQLETIKQFVSYFLSHYFQTSQSRWKDKMHFDVIFNCLLLSVNYKCQLQQLQQKIQQNYFNLLEMLEILYNFYLLDKIYQMKHKLKDFTQSMNIISEIKKRINQIELKISKKQLQTAQNNEKWIILTVRDIVKIKSGQMYSDNFDEVQRYIQNDSSRILLIKIIFMTRLQNAWKFCDYELYVQTIEAIKRKFQTSKILHSRTFAERMYWNFTLLSKNCFALQSTKFITQIKNTFNCLFVYDEFVFKCFENYQEIVENSDYFLSFARQIVNTCFGQKRLQSFLLYLRIVIEILSKNDNLITSNIDFVIHIAEKYLKHFESKIIKIVEQNLKEINFNNQFQPRSDQMEILHLCQSCFYIFLIKIDQQLNKYKNKYETIISNLHWQALQKYSTSNNIALEQISLPILIYYTAFKHKYRIQSLWHYFLTEIIQLKMISTKLPTYIFTSIIMDIYENIYLCKYQLTNIDTKNQLLAYLLVQIWKYHKVNDLMIAYFTLNLKQRGSFLISDTILILINYYHNNKQADNFLKDIVEVVSRNPYNQNVDLFMTNICYLFDCKRQLFDYDRIEIHLGPINWSNRYQVAILAFALINISPQRKYQIMIAIIKHIDYVSWICREEILYICLEFVLLLRVCSTKKKRKQFMISRFLATKIHVKDRSYHKSKLNVYTQLIKLKKRQTCFFRQKLRKKILSY